MEDPIKQITEHLTLIHQELTITRAMITRTGVKLGLTEDELVYQTNLIDEYHDGKISFNETLEGFVKGLDPKN